MLHNASRGYDWLRSNRLYFSYLVISQFLLLPIMLWPVITDTIESATGFDGVPLLGMSREKPLHRTTLFRVCLVWTISGAAAYGVCFSVQRFRILRAIALAGAVCGQGCLVVANHRLIHAHFMTEAHATHAVFEEQWPNFQHLRIIDCKGAGADAFQFREDLSKKRVVSFVEFHHYVMQEFRANRNQLNERWSAVADGDEEKLKTLFIMNLISGLWSFGNHSAVDRVGCAYCNEENDWQFPDLTLASYLDARIGCCSDYAFLAKSVLDHEGIENRLTCIPGHVFNEVKIGGRWCILDPTVNVFVDCSWGDLYTQERSRGSITVLLFPRQDLNDPRSARYRSVAGHFRLLTLTRIANHPSHLRQTEHPELPRYFAPDTEAK